MRASVPITVDGLKSACSQCNLVELCLPNEMDKKRGKWSFANLPIVPDHFELKPIEKTQPRFNLIKRLLKRADIAEVINAVQVP